MKKQMFVIFYSGDAIAIIEGKTSGHLPSEVLEKYGKHYGFEVSKLTYDRIDVVQSTDFLK